MAKSILEIDLDYLHELLERYESLKIKSKEKKNIRNAIMELLIPGIKTILLVYRSPLDFDMFQDLMLDLMKQIEKWDSTRTKRKKQGDAGDWAFFVRNSHNFCRNYVNRENKLKQREILVDPTDQSYWGTLISRELPREIDIPKIRYFKDENLQNAYEYCLQALLGENINHNGLAELRGKVRGKHGLTYEETKNVLRLAEKTIWQYIKEFE